MGTSAAFQGLDNTEFCHDVPRQLSDSPINPTPRQNENRASRQSSGVIVKNNNTLLCFHNVRTEKIFLLQSSYLDGNIIVTINIKSTRSHHMEMCLSIKGDIHRTVSSSVSGDAAVMQSV